MLKKYCWFHLHVPFHACDKKCSVKLSNFNVLTAKLPIFFSHSGEAFALPTLQRRFLYLLVVVISGFSSQQTRQNFKCGILLSAVLQNQVTDLHSSICSQGLEECWALMQRWYQTQSNFSVFLLKQRGLMGQWNIIILISCAEGYSRCNWQHISPKKTSVTNYISDKMKTDSCHA